MFQQEFELIGRMLLWIDSKLSDTKIWKFVVEKKKQKKITWKNQIHSFNLSKVTDYIKQQPLPWNLLWRTSVYKQMFKFISPEDFF